MTLKSDIVEWFGGENRWPGELEDELDNVTLVEDEIVDTSRWSSVHEAVFVRKALSGRDSDGELTFASEYVRVTYNEPATELQWWDGFGAPDVEEVEPVEITKTVFRTKE